MSDKSIISCGVLMVGIFYRTKQLCVRMHSRDLGCWQMWSNPFTGYLQLPCLELAYWTTLWHTMWRCAATVHHVRPVCGWKWCQYGDLNGDLNQACLSPPYFIELGDCIIASTLAFTGCLNKWNELQLSSAVQVYVESSDQWFTIWAIRILFY